MRQFFIWLPKALFFLACFGLVWLSGAIIGLTGTFPAPQLKQAIIVLGSIKYDPVPHHLVPAVYDFAGVRIHSPQKVADGSILITSYFKDIDWKPAAKLIDTNGNLLHVWNVDVEKLFPRDIGRNDYIHGTYVFPDGDILLNVEYRGLVRLDSCSNAKWTLSVPRTHHSIHPTSDGNFWVPGIVEILADAKGLEYLDRFKVLEAPVYAEHLLKISPDGKILAKIDLLDVLYRNELQRYIQKIGKSNSRDILHLNDVEELPPKTANEYSLFESGDLVVSLRSLHLVFVLDPESLAVKWHAQDPWIGQHDPDFIGNGRIGIFDNNRDWTNRGTVLGGSRIISIKPDTGEIKQLYPTEGAGHFHSDEGGKWQLLENGNYLITEAGAGRIFEVSPEDGKTVWEWVNDPFDATSIPEVLEGTIPEVLEGTKYQYPPEQIAKWPCSMSSQDND